MARGLTGPSSAGGQKFLGFFQLLLHQDLVEIAKTIWKPQKYTAWQYSEY